LAAKLKVYGDLCCKPVEEVRREMQGGFWNVLGNAFWIGKNGEIRCRECFENFGRKRLKMGFLRGKLIFASVQGVVKKASERFEQKSAYSSKAKSKQHGRSSEFFV
jgi:hypothetical protein